MAIGGVRIDGRIVFVGGDGGGWRGGVGRKAR